MNFHIVTLPGDGIGPDVTHEAVRVLQDIAEKFGHTFTFEAHRIGGNAIDATGSALPQETLDACLKADAVLLGAVGGPKWDDPRAKTRPEDGLLAIRKGLGLYANLRPVKPHPALAFASPLREEKIHGVDFIVVRELTGGLYFGEPKERRKANGHVSAVDTLEYHDYEIRRIVDLAFKLARPRKKKLASVDKANVLASSRLWREIATEMAADYPDVKLDHVLVDTAAMRLVTAPASFDVIVTENTFGDILTDEAAVLVGSMGLLPSASLGQGTIGLYEPIHGSAPDIAGKGIANPLGSILSAAMLLRHSLHLETEAVTIERAVERALTDGCRTADIARQGERVLNTTQMTDEVIKRVQ
ncbi:MAG: 3-isopropylmalate dehydrogenase [Chloroflexi bacterium]|nr:3-isopropylmalate dehydrogenase [Chloroflexota bacterium]